MAKSFVFKHSEFTKIAHEKTGKTGFDYKFRYCDSVVCIIAWRLLRLKKMGNVKVVNTMLIQSRPIQMRGTILYLAIHWWISKCFQCQIYL